MTLYPFSFTTKKGSESIANIISFLKDYLLDLEDGIRQLLAWFLNLVMEKGALLQAGAKRYEVTDSRKASGKDHKSCSLQTKHGELELLKPQFREFPFETEVIENYYRVEKAILSTASESYLKGVFIRRVKKIMTA